MSMRCTVCDSPHRAAIDRALAGGKESNRRIANRFAVTEAAVQRHGAAHVPATLAKAVEAGEAARASDLLARVWERAAKAERLADVAEAVVGRAVGQADWRTALAAIATATQANKELRECVSLLAKLRGELDDRPQVNLLVAPEWLAVRTALLEALAPYPDARLAVAGRLRLVGAA